MLARQGCLQRRLRSAPGWLQPPRGPATARRAIAFLVRLEVEIPGRMRRKWRAASRIPPTPSSPGPCGGVPGVTLALPHGVGPELVAGLRAVRALPCRPRLPFPAPSAVVRSTTRKDIHPGVKGVCEDRHVYVGSVTCLSLAGWLARWRAREKRVEIQKGSWLGTRESNSHIRNQNPLSYH